MTDDFGPQPQPHDAVIGRRRDQPATDAVLGGRERRSSNNWTWGFRYEQGDDQNSLYTLLRQCLEPGAPDQAIFCQLTPDFTFQRQNAAIYGPRSRAHVIYNEHSHVQLLWGFRGRNPQISHFHQTIWYNLFYFQTKPLRQLLSSLQAGFNYNHIPQAKRDDWAYHFASTFSRCAIRPNDHHIMAHMALFYPRAYAVAYSYWQTQYQLDIPPQRQLQLQEWAIDAVIELANYYLWFQMNL